MNGACNNTFFSPTPWDPGEKSKGQISLNFINKVNFNDFYTNCVCVLTNKRHKTYGTGFLFCRPGHAPGVGFGGPRGSIFFSDMVMWHIKSMRTMSTTECK